jgi:2-polyprenyl-6-methoxyphenol hydroxylase-like FAD-dependent oxidoreductase
LKNSDFTDLIYTSCSKCKGQGKISRRISKKLRFAYQQKLENFEKSNDESIAPIRPKAHLESCSNCLGSGLVSAISYPIPDTKSYPNVAIIGGGIGGVALAAACLHRGIPFTIYERDSSFDQRSQGYGLTLQQASKAIEGFGIFNLQQGVISTRHLVHTTDGKVIGEWGMRKWMQSDNKSKPKRTNIHIARQSLRLALLERAGGINTVKWKHQLIDLKQSDNDGVELNFMVDGEIKKVKADLVVGADGIRSSVRKILIGDIFSPLQYLDCIAILGICPLSAIQDVESSLLDSATVFQTANGNERIYIMPYDAKSVMWQLSFPMEEDSAKKLSAEGKKALKKEAIKRTLWHSPIPQIVAATNESQISGYPVYDRELLHSDILAKSGQATLIGDAAHPMSPFKGQGANQALLDALLLARIITKECRPFSNWREVGIRESVLNAFESEMLKRSAIKVKQSAEAAEFLHSDLVLKESNEPRGRNLSLKKKE